MVILYDNGQNPIIIFTTDSILLSYCVITEVSYGHAV
jgi:hypothetical protein